MGPEKPGIFVCPDKIKDLSLSHAFPQGMLFYSPKNFKAMMKNNETFTYKGHSYLIPTHNDENANIRFTGFKLKFNGQTLTPGDGEEPYFTITDTNADQSFSLFMEETDCDDMSAVYIVPFYIYREDESQPLLALTESMTSDFNFEATFPAPIMQMSLIIPGLHTCLCILSPIANLPRAREVLFRPYVLWIL